MDAYGVERRAIKNHIIHLPFFFIQTDKICIRNHLLLLRLFAGPRVSILTIFVVVVVVVRLSSVLAHGKQF